MEIKIIETKEQLEDAFKVRRQVFVDEQQVPEEEEIDGFEDICTHFVMYDAELPIGAGRFREVDGLGKIERICVLKEYRGTGAGKKLMEFIEQFATSQQFSTLKLNAQTHAIPFYSRLGYEVSSEEFMDAGIPHRSMKKKIN